MYLMPPIFGDVDELTGIQNSLAKDAGGAVYCMVQIFLFACPVLYSSWGGEEPRLHTKNAEGAIVNIIKVAGDALVFLRGLDAPVI